MRRICPGPVLAVLLVAILSLACNTGSTRPKFIEEIVLFGYLYVGGTASDTVAIHLDRTRPVDEYYDAARAAVLNAVVTLRADSSAADRPAVEYTLPMAEPGVYATTGVVIREKTTYHLKAIIDGKTVTATTTTPSAFETPREPRVLSAGAMPQSAIADSFPIVVACPDPEQICLVDVYCLEDWRSARFIHRLGGREDHPQSYDEYGRDNGEPRHIAAYFRLRDIQQSDQGYVVSFYGDMMWFFGQYLVGVFSLDENYYNYLYRDHPELHGGVSGGIGVFGSACRKQYRVQVVE
jgi:hypothetical protein